MSFLLSTGEPRAALSVYKRHTDLVIGEFMYGLKPVPFKSGAGGSLPTDSCVKQELS
jgi:hypothetical protein